MLSPFFSLLVRAKVLKPVMLPGVEEGVANAENLETEWDQIACGAAHTVAITREGDLYTWGSGYNGQTGQNNIATEVPTIVTGLTGKNVVHVTCGLEHTAVITREGDLYTWYVYNCCITYIFFTLRVALFNTK